MVKNEASHIASIKDFRFKIWLLNELVSIDLIRIPSELEQMRLHPSFGTEDVISKHKIKAIKLIMDFPLEKDVVLKLKSINIGAGFRVDFRSSVDPYWNGEDSYFDIKTFDGIEHLKNLKVLNLYSGISQTTDFHSIKKCQGISKISLGVWPGKRSSFVLNFPNLKNLEVPEKSILVKYKATFEKLKKNNVKIKYTFK